MVLYTTYNPNKGIAEQLTPIESSTHSPLEEYEQRFQLLKVGSRLFSITLSVMFEPNIRVGECERRVYFISQKEEIPLIILSEKIDEVMQQIHRELSNRKRSR